MQSTCYARYSGVPASFVPAAMSYICMVMPWVSQERSRARNRTRQAKTLHSLSILCSKDPIIRACVGGILSEQCLRYLMGDFKSLRCSGNRQFRNGLGVGVVARPKDNQLADLNGPR